MQQIFHSGRYTIRPIAQGAGWGYGVWNADGEAVFIDPGVAWPEIQRLLGLFPARAVGILLTQGTWAAVGRAQEIGQRLACPLALHQQDLSGLRVVPLEAKKRNLCGILMPWISILICDESTPLPWSIQAWETPGSTPGGVTYQVGEAFFCGDLSVPMSSESRESADRRRRSLDALRGRVASVRGMMYGFQKPGPVEPT